MYSSLKSLYSINYYNFTHRALVYQVSFQFSFLFFVPTGTTHNQSWAEEEYVTKCGSSTSGYWREYQGCYVLDPFEYPSSPIPLAAGKFRPYLIHDDLLGGATPLVEGYREGFMKRRLPVVSAGRVIGSILPPAKEPQEYEAPQSSHGLNCLKLGLTADRVWSPSPSSVSWQHVPFYLAPGHYLSKERRHWDTAVLLCVVSGSWFRILVLTVYNISQDNSVGMQLAHR